MNRILKKPGRESSPLRRLLLCALPAVLIAESLLCNLSIDPHYVADEALAGRSAAFQFLIYTIRSFSVDAIVGACVTLGALALLYYLRRIRPTMPERVMACCFGFLFSCMQLIGWSYENYGSWDALVGSRFIEFRALVVLAGQTLLFACLALYGFRLVDRLVSGEEGTGRLSWKHFLLAAGLVILCWLPYYYLFFPGMGNPDTSMQIAWALHYPQDWLQYSPVRGPEIYATNHHPYFTTVLFGLFAKIGLRINGNIYYGVALYNLLQMILTALAMTGAWFYLRRIGLRGRYCKVGLVFTALFPLFPLYAITMLKDSLFSLACLTFSLLLFETARTRGESLKKIWFDALLFLNALLVALSKNQGVYFVAVAAVVCLIFCRQRIRAVVTLIVPVLLFQYVWLQILLPAWNVAPGGKQEVLGLLFQQTARYVTMYPEDVTEEEADAIRAVIDYDHLAELYKPTLADPVKFTYNQDATEEELSAYYQAWKSMFRRHPDAYVQAFLHNIYGSFYTERQTALSYTDFDDREGSQHPDLYVEKTERLEKAQPIVLILLPAIQHLPGIGMLFCIGFYPWVILFIFLDTLRRKRYAQILSQLPAILSVAVLLLAPVSGSYRYAMPMIYMIPFLLSTCLLPRTALPTARKAEAVPEGETLPEAAAATPAPPETENLPQAENGNT
jgi:hypothetical protein